jgi:hypothetical protein
VTHRIRREAPTTERSAALPCARAVDPRAAALLSLQRGSGNAAVTRMLTRQVADASPPRQDDAAGEPIVEPHGPGGDADTASALADAKPDGPLGLLGAIADVVSSAADAAVQLLRTAPAPGPPESLHIAHSVGAGGANEPADVKVIADRLRTLGFGADAGDPHALAAVIRSYQAEVLGWTLQDGRVDPAGQTLRALAAGRKATPASTAPLTVAPGPTGAPASPPPTAQPPAPDAALDAWAAEQPATNPEWAAWIIAAQTHGFVTIKANTRKQLDQFVEGKKVAGADGGAGATLLGGLATVGAMIRGRVTRWRADPSQGKQPFLFGDMVRNLKGLSIPDAHATGAAVDIGGFDFGGADGPKQVMQALEDLPAGTYGIGLPFQGQFFPAAENIAVREQNAQQAAGPGGIPADITTPSLVMWRSTRETAKWDPGKTPAAGWVNTVVDYDARSRMRSAELKAKFAELKSVGKSFIVFPDAPNHIHIKRM